MFPYTKEYVWREGIPQGVSEIETPGPDEELVKIVYDSYQKHYSIERYRGPHFESVIYDSKLLNFATLSPIQQQAWSKEVISEDNTLVRCLIRDESDRVVAIEEYHYEGELCRRCDSISPHGPLLSRQRIYYQSLGDPIDGVVLFDANEHPVMFKTYTLNEDGSFGTLLSEEWDMLKHPPAVAD